MTRKMPLSLLLKRARKKQHLTQSEIAKKMNVADTTIKYWEAGRRIPTRNFIIKIADAYQLSIEDINKSIHYSKQFRKELKEYGRKNNNTDTDECI